VRRPSARRMVRACSPASAAHSAQVPANAGNSSAAAGGTWSNGTSWEWEWSSDAPAAGPSLIAASR
jgi:hypothetical protein